MIACLPCSYTTGNSASESLIDSNESTDDSLSKASSDVTGLEDFFVIVLFIRGDFDFFLCDLLLSSSDSLLVKLLNFRLLSESFFY